MAVSALAFAADPFVGTWKLLVDRSTFDDELTPRPRNVTIKWQSVATNTFKVSHEGVDAGGKSFSGAYVAIYDGKEYPNSGGPWGWDKVVNKSIDSHTREDTFYKNGKIFGVERRVVSADGKTYTVTGRFYTPKGERKLFLVYERQ